MFHVILKVLSAFKTLHRTRKLVFQDDEAALTAARAKINEEYKKCMHVKDETAINELLKYSNEVENILRTTVIQAKEVGPGKYGKHRNRYSC